ncbi:MAG: chloride channel protein [Bacteroidales bacterium]|nr:chloride channel protein [Bacteroidales bacterium]
MKTSKHLYKILLWRQKHISNKDFIIVMSLVVGLLSGFSAVMLKNVVHHTGEILTSGFDVGEFNFLYLAYPIIGISLTVMFVKYIIKDNLGHGVSRILYAMAKRSGILRVHNMFSSMIASTLTVGFGGSVGLEAPIVLTGASIGSNLGRWFKLNSKTILLLIGCGASGAIAGIFKAPIAGIIFTLEVLMLDLTLASIIPLMISSVTATTVAYFFLGSGADFSFPIKESFIVNNIPYYILLGIFAGLISLYFTRMTMRIETFMGKFKKRWQKLLFGGLSLGVLIFFFPSLYGEGYGTLMASLHGDADAIVRNSFFYSFKDNFWLFGIVLLMIIFFKVIAMAITTGSGGVGGIFAPSLFTGGITGYFMAYVLNRFEFIKVPVENFALAGMAGIMAGVMHSPLTAIFLIAEITGGYQLFMPLIITSTISFLTIMYFEPHSIYTKRLASRGELMTHSKDRTALSRISVRRLIETNFNTVIEGATLGELTEVISKSQRNVFPVIDAENNFKGVVFINDIRNIVFKTEIYETTYVNDLMFMPKFCVEPGESMDSVTDKFNKGGDFNLPVIKNGKYMGFVSRARVFSEYRKIVAEFSED